MFVDDYLIEELINLDLRMHEPRPAGVAVKYDGETEDWFCFYTTILKDGDIYRMYYRGRVSPDKQPYASSNFSSRMQTTCYAESRDGINWIKPNLGLVEVNGSRDNNVILETLAHNFTPFIDRRPGVPKSERYKANIAEPRKNSPEHILDLLGYVSGDGINWRLARKEAIVPGEFVNSFDGQTAMFWSEVEQRYVLYARHAVGGRRAAARATSEDFFNWTPQILMTYSDTDTTTPSQHLYVNQTSPYFRAPHIYISLPGRLQSGRRALSEEQAKELNVSEIGGGAVDISDGVFLTTRAGTSHYDFRFRESFIRPGIGLNNWTSRSNFPALGVVPTGPAEMSIYVQRNYGQESAFLERMTLRVDGFVSVHAPYNGGELITKPLRFTGRELEMNYGTSAAGSIRVEIQDEDGNPFPGYEIRDCPEIIGDQIERVVSWKNGSDVSSLAGRVIRLRFQMNDADLFSIRFR